MNPQVLSTHTHTHTHTHTTHTHAGVHLYEQEIFTAIMGLACRLCFLALFIFILYFHLLFYLSVYLLDILGFRLVALYDLDSFIDEAKVSQLC